MVTLVESHTPAEEASDAEAEEVGLGVESRSGFPTLSQNALEGADTRGMSRATPLTPPPR